MPDGNGLVEVDCPREQVIWKSCGHFMPLPSSEFSITYQRGVGWGGGVSVSEPKFTSDGVKKRFLDLNYPKAIGGMDLPLDQRGVTLPKSSLFHTEKVDIKIHRPK